jgi:hypothetical protein
MKPRVRRCIRMLCQEAAPPYQEFQGAGRGDAPSLCTYVSLLALPVAAPAVLPRLPYAPASHLPSAACVVVWLNGCGHVLWCTAATSCFLTLSGFRCVCGARACAQASRPATRCVSMAGVPVELLPICVHSTVTAVKEKTPRAQGRIATTADPVSRPLVVCTRPALLTPLPVLARGCSA